jgi:hypothetical protein
MTCESEQEPTLEIELIVNGLKVELNSFVQNFIGRAVVGMLTSLRGVSNVQSVSLKISKPSD